MTKLSLKQKLENMGYKESYFRTYIKELEYNKYIKQVIKLNFYDDHILEEWYVETFSKMKEKEIEYIIIAKNRVKSDFEKLLKEIEQDESK